MPAGRISPEPPGSGSDEPPPAGTALAPPAGVTGGRPLRERDSVRSVAETGTKVKKFHHSGDGNARRREHPFAEASRIQYQDEIDAEAV